MAKIDRLDVIARLKAHEVELRGLGISSLSLFGSVARGEATRSSDVDLSATFDDARHVGMFDFATIAARLKELLGQRVDLVGEPARKSRMQREIDRDRLRVF